jgi:hypothetical protein
MSIDEDKTKTRTGWLIESLTFFTTMSSKRMSIGTPHKILQSHARQEQRQVDGMRALFTSRL